MVAFLAESGYAMLCMDAKNQIFLDYRNNPALASLFDGKVEGDKVEVCITVQIDRLTQEGAQGTIVKIESENEETDKKDGAEPTEATPAMIVIGPKNGVPPKMAAIPSAASMMMGGKM